MPYNFSDWLRESQGSPENKDQLISDGGFDFDEWLRQAQEAQRKQEEEQERLAQERAALEKQRKEELVMATQADEAELDFDSVVDSLIQAESSGDPNAVNINKNGTGDYGSLQINERWINKGLSTSGRPSYAVNPANGELDNTYAKVQDHMASQVPNWNMMSDEFRRESLFDPDLNREVGRIIYGDRGIDSWSAKDKALEIQTSKKRVEHTGDLANQALSGNIPSLDDISVSFLSESLPAEIDPDYSPVLMRNKDRKKRLEEAERPKDWKDAFAEVAKTPSNIVPFLQTQNEMQDLAEISAHIDAIKKADEGDYDPPSESIFKVHEWQTQNQAETSRGYDIWNTVFGSIPFAGELYFTGGVFTGGKKVAVKGLKEGLKWGLGRKGRDLVGKYAVKNGFVKKAGELSLKSTAAIGASGVQTLAIEALPEAQRVFTGIGGGRIRAQTVMNMMDRVGIQESEKGDLEAVLFEEGDDFWDAFSKGAANVFIENLSEQSGLLFSKIPAGAKGMLIRRGILEKFLTKNKGATVGQFRSILRRAGWNGVIGEIVEERAGDVARSITYNVAGVGDETWELPTLEELGDRLLTEFPAFMIPGGAFGAVSATLSRDSSDLTKPTNALKFLNKANYKLKVEKNDKTGKYDMQVLIGDNVTTVDSFDSKKEAQNNLNTYVVEEAGRLRDHLKTKLEDAPIEERQVFPEENKQGQAYISRISKMSAEDLEKEQANISNQLDKAKTERQKTYRQRQLSAIEDVMAPAIEEAPVVEEPKLTQAEIKAQRKKERLERKILPVEQPVEPNQVTVEATRGGTKQLLTHRKNEDGTWEAFVWDKKENKSIWKPAKSKAVIARAEKALSEKEEAPVVTPVTPAIAPAEVPAVGVTPLKVAGDVASAESVAKGERLAGWSSRSAAEKHVEEGYKILPFYEGKRGAKVKKEKRKRLSEDYSGITLDRFMDEVIIYKDTPEGRNVAEALRNDLLGRGGFWSVTTPEADIAIARLAEYKESEIKKFIQEEHPDFNYDAYNEQYSREQFLSDAKAGEDISKYSAPAVEEAPVDYDKISNVEQLEFSQKNLKKDLKKAKAEYKENPSFGAQGRIDDIQSQLKAIGFQLSSAKKEAPAVEDTRTPEEIEAENLALQEEMGIVETKEEAGEAIPPQGMVQEEVEEINDIDEVDEREQNAIRNLEKKMGVKKFFDDSDPNYTFSDTMKDAAIVGAGIIRRGAKSFKQFSAEMVSKIGKGVKPYLKKLYNNAKTYVREYIKNPKIGAMIEVVHGTAGEFEQFKATKIGTGEGAQAFGYGLYFTNQKEVAENYAKQLRGRYIPPSDPIKRKEYDKLQAELVEVGNTIWDADRYGRTDREAEREARDRQLMIKNRIDELEERAKGVVYKATIHKGKKPSEYDYIRWADTISVDQAQKIALHGKKVLNEKKHSGVGGLEDALIEYTGEAIRYRTVTGMQIYNRLASLFGGSQHSASKFLLDSGIDGIRYPAQGMTGGRFGENENFVVFDERAITIEATREVGEKKWQYRISELFKPVPIKYEKNRQDKPLISIKTLQGKNQKQAGSILNWMWEFGLGKADFVKGWSRNTTEKDRGGLSRRQYEIKVLERLHPIAKKKFIEDVRAKHKKAQTKANLVETFESGKHIMDWYDNFYEYMQKEFKGDADLAIDFIAITSAGVDLKANITFGLKGYAQYKLNDKIETGLYPATIENNLQNAISNHKNRNNPSYKPKPIGKEKVTNFSKALKGDENAVVLDMWMAREFGLWQKATPKNLKPPRASKDDPSKVIKGTAVYVYGRKGALLNGAKGQVMEVRPGKVVVEYSDGQTKIKKAFSYKSLAVIKDTFTSAEYARYEQVVKEIARDRGVTPRQAQAAIWFGIREGHSSMHKGEPGLESQYYEDILDRKLYGYTNEKGEKIPPWFYEKGGKRYGINDIKQLTPDIHDAFNSFSSFPSPAQMDLVKTMLIDAGRFTYDNLSPAMQKLGNRLGIDNSNFKLRFAQYANNARNMTEASKKWFKNAMIHMKAWFRKNAKKLIESKPMQKAYKRIENIAVKRIVPEGEMPDMAPAKSEESPKERRSAIMDFIEENGGLPPKINPYTKSKLALMFYDKVLVPISTRLGRIHPQLKRIIRRYHENADINTGRDMINVGDFLTKVEKLNKVQRDKLDLAMINAWGEEIDKLINEYDIVEEYNKVRDVLNGIYDRAVGLDGAQYQRYRQLKDFILPDLQNVPKSAWKRDEIMAWLDRQGVKYSKASTKAQLLVNAEKKAKSEAAKYKNLKEEFDDLDRQVIYDIPYYEHYHPREILSYDKLLEHIVGAKLEGDLDIALNDKARSLGIDKEDLTEQQRVDTINIFFRNTTGSVAKTPKNVMKRKFIELDAEMSTYYKDSSSALISYISRMNEAIARAELFGKGTGVVGANIENLNDKDVGAFIDGIRMNQDPKNPVITPEKEEEIKEIFRAKFSRNYTDSGTQALKNLVYIGTIGDYMSTLTQLGDLGFAGYRSVMAGHPIVFLKTLYKGFISGNLKITTKDIGMDRIAVEFSRDQATFSATLGKIFKKSGFAKLDRIGKEVLVNSTIETMRVQANSKKGLSKKNMGIINAAFGEGTKEAKDVIEQIKAGETNENVISLAYWVLLEHQPVAESELPAQYLESDAGKLVYQLKTWAIKVLDVYRNEVYDTIFEKKQVVTGLTNFAQLTLALMMANVGADWLKGFILGKPIRLTDQVVDNLLKLVFLSKYTFSKRQLRPGNSQVIRSLAGNAVPLLSLADDVLSDAYTVSKWFTVGLDRNESLQYDLKLPSRIPFVGRLIFHRGGMQGRERVLNRELKYYKELAKERSKKGQSLNPVERFNFNRVAKELGVITVAKAQGSKGGFLKEPLKAIGIGD